MKPFVLRLICDVRIVMSVPPCSPARTQIDGIPDAKEVSAAPDSFQPSVESLSKPPPESGRRKKVVSVSVRDLVSFVLRTGDLGGGAQFNSPNRALEGTRGHQRLQKSRPAGYESEVAVSCMRETPDFTLELKGRIDGVWIRDGELLIEEIKTVSNLSRAEADPLHWGQAKIYAYLYARDRHIGRVHVQITYVALDSHEVVEFRESCTLETLSSFFEKVVSEYLEWICAHRAWIQSRDESIAQLDFPFQTYRPGQRSLAVAVYRTIKTRGRLFAEAPTGIGKTMSVLFPSIKALGEGRIEKIFYATAKTIGRSVAESTLADLRAKGLGIRAVTLTAREKICFNNGQPCDLKTCPFAIGYYDRIKNALKASLDRESFTRTDIEKLAREFQICPFELSLDLSLWADVVICDYNYVFDPSACLKRFFSGERQDFAILVDEAHNLVERAREMFSAVLEKNEILALRATLHDELPACARILNRINARFLKFCKEDGWQARQEQLVRPGVPEKLTHALRDFCEEAELWLVQNHPSHFRRPLLEFYFQCLAFLRVAELYDDRYLTTFHPRSGRLRLFCIDPAPQIRAALENIGASVFFSATLTPIGYFMESLAGEIGHHHLKLDSPFPSANLEILVHPKITTRLRERESSYDEIVAAIAAMARAKAGNYLVYFSSYEYMQKVLDRFRARHPEIESTVQTSGMAEAAREEFLSRFQHNSVRTMVAFAVLGGVFGEGIDLVGERLIGVAVVGVGLPQLCLERDLIREYWQRDARSGFNFAYTYPGMNRVLQAAGRVIRSERDRGVVLLLDERFGKGEHRNLFPPWWGHRTVTSAKQIEQAATRFWSESPEGNHCCETEPLASE